MNMNTFFFSDPHFGHGNILRYTKRYPWLTPEERKLVDTNVDFCVNWQSVRKMDNDVIANINDLVKADDVLYFLGDFAFGSRGQSGETAAYYRKCINCKTIYCVQGNHDRPKWWDRNLFYVVAPQIETYVGNQFFVLNHCAMAIWNKCHHGAIHLYGHSHSSAESWLDSIMPERRSMDVGIDNLAKIFAKKDNIVEPLAKHYRPISVDEVLEIMRDRKQPVVDHHGQD
jgi:calcineurin-like phosphoesterase family protein